MVHRHNITREEMIVMEGYFMSNANLCFFCEEPCALLYILTGVIFGGLFKVSVTGWEKIIYPKSRWSKNNLGVTEILVSKLKVPFQEAFFRRRHILIVTISNTYIDTGWVNYSIVISSYGNMILEVVVNFQHRMVSKFLLIIMLVGGEFTSDSSRVLEQFLRANK